MSVYETLIGKVEKGGSFYVDLNTKTLKINNKFYVRDGVILVDDVLISNDEIGDNPWSVISSLFQNYQRSVPSHKEKKHSYFKALSVDELSTVDLAYNEKRNVAQAKLEGYVLLASTLGFIEWQNENHWFWQDPINSECIILKEWIK